MFLPTPKPPSFPFSCSPPPVPNISTLRLHCQRAISFRCLVRSSPLRDRKRNRSTCAAPPSMTDPVSSSQQEQQRGEARLPLIDTTQFYNNYFGHLPHHLSDLIEHKPSNVPTLYLVGDSTLDNKYWIPDQNELHPNPYIRSRLSRKPDNTPLPLHRDIAYWLSGVYQADEYTVINCAVEQSMLRTRTSKRSGKLFPQDELTRDNLKKDDVLVVSVGGNDVALIPTVTTALSVVANVFLGGRFGMDNLKYLFRDELQKYVELVTEKCRPRLVVLCMTYFPDENSSQKSWAGWVLQLLNYNRAPQWLQSSTRRVFEEALSDVKVEGCQVAFAPLYEALDGKNSRHYVQRVEPSEEGGSAIAQLLKKVIDEGLSKAGKSEEQ